MATKNTHPGSFLGHNIFLAPSATHCRGTVWMSVAVMRPCECVFCCFVTVVILVTHMFFFCYWDIKQRVALEASVANNWQIKRSTAEPFKRHSGWRLNRPIIELATACATNPKQDGEQSGCKISAPRSEHCETCSHNRCYLSIIRCLQATKYIHCT